MTQISVPRSVGKLDLKEIESQLALCPSLPSLGSINKALQGLLLAEQRFSAQISEIIRRDPSLTSRLLRLVNSVYYGLTTPVNSIEEAVFYLGVRQIRQLTMVTPIIEDFQRLTKQCAFPWREFWQHSIGTAILRIILRKFTGRRCKAPPTYCKSKWKFSGWTIRNSARCISNAIACRI
jgi:HD-like signal output (HDOD) protein